MKLPIRAGYRTTLLVLGLFLSASPCLAAKDDDKDDKEKKPKTYADIITEETVTDRGLFDVHRLERKLFFEIPTTMFGRDMLLVSRIARVPSGLSGGFMAAGHKTGEQVVRWERRDDRILLRKVSYRNVADPELPINISVVNNNFAPILAAFDEEITGRQPSEETGADSVDTVVIDVTSFYEEDIPALSGLDRSLRDDYKVKSLDKSRSFLNYAHSYPLNVDVRHTLTFKTEKPPVDAETETLSLEMHQSMILLPEEPMRPRHADSRIGWFTVTQTNYGLDRQKAAEETFLRRWRLEPSDPAAYARGELVEPVKPIVYYLDPATPDRWRPWVKQGVEDWNAAFETAGFKNAIEAREAPTPEENPEWNGEDIRYSMVRWAATTVRNAMGPSVSDPRSGEIIESDIVWYHNHMRTYRNRLMIETGAANPLARSLPIDGELMGEAMRQVIAHEIGHALGLPHNMIASSSYPVDSLRSPAFARRMGVAPSVMEYGRQNYIAQPGDGLEGADFIRQIGPYDHYTINWGYRVIPDAATAEDEKPVLDGWIEERAGDPIYRYARQRSGSPVDPRTQTEDLGDDPVKAGEYAIRNLKVVAPRLIEWTSTPGEDYADLSELYGTLVFQWYRYLSHVVPVVGGLYEDLKSTDQAGVVYTPVPASRQRRALEFIAGQGLATPHWLNDTEILRRIEHDGAVNRIGGYQARLLDNLLSPERLQRLIEIEALEGRDAYSPLDFLADLKHAVWSEFDGRKTIDTFRRNLQRAYIERLEWLMTEDPPVAGRTRFRWSTPVDVSRSDIRALARAHLGEIEASASRAASRSGDRMTRWHLEDIAGRIRSILDVSRGAG